MHSVSSTIPGHEQTALGRTGHEAILASDTYISGGKRQRTCQDTGSLGHSLRRMVNYLQKTIQNNVSYSNHREGTKKKSLKKTANAGHNLNGKKRL